jgi:hypothetical protein
VNQEILRFLQASASDRRDVFLQTAGRVGTPEQNIEKDLWVCWTLDALFNGGLDAGGPRLLFKGGTSLSKAFGLITRFSEDIDITVFREDLGVGATIEQLEGLSGKKRQARLDAIRDTCRSHISRPMLNQLGHTLDTLLSEAGLRHDQGRVELDSGDPDGQTLLVYYPAVTGLGHEDYIRPAVRIESGAKSALDPHHAVHVTPYIQQVLTGFHLEIGNITTVDATRTFWDKVIIVHGLRRWYERRGVLRQEGQRVSRHYYDLHALLQSDVGRQAVRNRDLGRDCVRHAQMFFNRPDLDLASAAPGTFAVAPVPGMIEALRRDHNAMAGMIFSVVPTFDQIMASIAEIDAIVNET